MKTIFACLTPPGKAAIATLAVHGPRAWELTRRFFEPHRGVLASEPCVGRFWLGRLGADNRDEVILAVKEGHVLEMHCHGGTEVVRMIQELYAEQGVEIMSWQAFLAVTAEDASRDPKGDRLPGAIVALLAHAPTARTAGILLEQAHGAWQNMLQQVAAGARSGILRRLDELIPLGGHLVEPWRVVIAGAPNVGKSSLMNALAGYTRSVVSPIPGTTRDVVSLRLAIDGWPVEMTDTAGLRQASSPIEHQGIDRARSAIDSADLRIWLVDGSVEPAFPQVMAGWCHVINKIDLPAGWDWNQVADAVPVSAQSLAGLPELCDTISRRLVPKPPLLGEAVPCLPEQVEWVRAQLAMKEQDDGLA